jgi:hypothetical protein
MEESRQSKIDRMNKNGRNFDCYHLKQDYSHKIPGQSREFLPRQTMAIEQVASFFQQALADIGEWYGVERAPGIKAADSLFTEQEVRELINRQLERADFLTYVGDGIKLGLLGSLIISKVHGEKVDKPIYYTEYKSLGNNKKVVLKKAEKKKWQLKLDLVRHENFYPDPTGKSLYFIAVDHVDLSFLEQMEKDGMFDKGKLEQVATVMHEEEVQQQRMAREVGQNYTFSNYRRRIKIAEYWGNLIDSVTGKLVMENCTWIVANDSVVLKSPSPNPFWHGTDPYVVSPIIRVPLSVWHRAMMDSPTLINVALNEIFNLIVDSGMMSTFGIKQVRTDWLEDETQISNGVRPGDTIKANSNTPVGAKVIERIDTSSMSKESLDVFNLLGSEFNQAALTNDLRQGVLPQRAVKATEVVEASQTITSVFTGIAKVLEVEFLEALLRKVWLTILQNMDDMDDQEMKDLLGEDRAQAISALSPEERFARSATGHKFFVHGITRTLSKIKDFKKITSLLQTIAGSQVLTEEFTKKYDFGKLLEEIMKSLDINTKKLELDQIDQASMQVGQQGGQMQAAGMGAAGPQPQTQIPSAMTGPMDQSVHSMLPRTNFSAVGQ